MKFYQKAILLSFTLHFSLMAFMFFSPAQPPAKRYVVKKIERGSKKPVIINTQSVDSEDIDLEIARIQEQKRQQRIKEQQRQLDLKNQYQQALDKRKQEEEALAALRKQKQRLESQRQKESALLHKEQNRLNKLKEKLARERAEAKRQRRKEAAQKRARLKKEQAEREARLRQEEAERQARLAKEAEEKRMELEKKQALAKQRAEARRQKQQQLVNAEVNKYKALIINAISQNWILPSGIDKSLSCRFEIQLASTGEVLNVKLLKSSGDPVLDRSARTAIYQASPLPVPTTPAAFEVFKIVSLTVKPEQVTE